MIHKPIKLQNLGLHFSHKICFADFTTNIACNSRIAIIGRNGSGKSTLLKYIDGSSKPIDGYIEIPDDAIIGYVPQTIYDFEQSSGGQRLNYSLTKALSHDPNVLLLDEPTNHLDHANRNSLMRKINSYQGTLLIASHDIELLNHCIDTIWHIDNEEIHIFYGKYDDYIQERSNNHEAILRELSELDKAKKNAHKSLMQEQSRAKNSKKRGKKSIQNRKWPTVTSHTKAGRANKTSDHLKKDINKKKQNVTDRLSQINFPKTISPKFSIASENINNQTVVAVMDGEIKYEHTILQSINLSILASKKVALIGTNGSGKSSLIKAIMNSKSLQQSDKTANDLTNSLIDSSMSIFGSWYGPKIDDIGYLDQHYSTLLENQSVLDTIQNIVPHWNMEKSRSHLNDFLFRKNVEINAKVNTLSGGEKARLSLAVIAAKVPKLLILDEITNNLDLETKEHVTQILKAFPGTLIVISHDENFLKTIEVDGCYQVANGM